VGVTASVTPSAAYVVADRCPSRLGKLVSFQWCFDPFFTGALLCDTSCAGVVPSVRATPSAKVCCWICSYSHRDENCLTYLAALGTIAAP